MLHPAEKPRRSFLEQATESAEGPFIAATDYVRAVPEQVAPWLPGEMFTLGTDGMGRSETREALRRHFEVDSQCVTLAALYQLCQQGELEAKSRPKGSCEAGHRSREGRSVLCLKCIHFFDDELR